MRKLFLTFALFTYACGAPVSAAAPDATPTFAVESANAATPQTALLPAPTITPTVTPAATLTPTSAPSAYEKYAIEYLRSRTYGGGDLKLAQTVVTEKNFTTYLAQYASDGLSIYALVSVPNDAQTHPVIVTIHGYFKSKLYDLYDDNKFIDDSFARQGFIVIHPAMRNYPPSDTGDNLFRVGQSVDILNLLAIVKTQSGKPGLLETADPQRIGVEGMSAGGGVALRALTVSPDIKAAVLYSSVSGDERRNVPFFQYVGHTDPQFVGETAAPESALIEISPASYYSSITAPILLAHGIDDWTVPITWGRETCVQLAAAGVGVTCDFYKDAPHSFSGADLKRFISRSVNFFNQHLR
jgi:dipeptidyl aminopeptidase/acylaminoacyl peptidase